MKSKIISIIICICLTIGITPVVQANPINDYKTIYLNYAKDADNNYNNKLNDAISGLILLDLNRDEVPELLAFSTSVSHFDEEGNQIYAFDEGYDNPAYKEYSHTIAKAFSIINGEIVEDSPWKHEMYSETISMPFLPNEDVVDTEEFCTTVQYRGREDYLVMHEISDWGSAFTALWYDEEGFGFSREGFDENFFNTYSHIDLPVASIQFYDDEQQQKRTRSEAMEILLSKYENAVNTSTYASNDKNKVSDWAEAEVNEAKELNLVPPEMLNDNLTENITRAEFAAIAVQLHQAIVGEELNWHGGYIIDIEDNMYEMYIRGAYNFGITNGTGEKDGGVIFSPDLNITREQLATMLCRVVKLNKFEDWISGDDSDFPLDISNTSKFSDDYQISDYANEAVYYMSKHGIIKGVDSTHFAPLDTATKEQAILLALRIYNAFDELPVTQKKEEKKELKINYNVIEKCENTTADQLISGLEDNKYTIDQLSDILNIDFQETGEVLDELGLVDCQSFEWNGYYITIISLNEEASSYRELYKYPTYIECDDSVMIDTTAIKDFKLNFTDLSLEVGEIYKTLHARISASRLSEVDVEWISSNEDIATVEDNGETGYIYAKKAGTVYITAQVQEGNKILQAQCKVTIEKEPEEESDVKTSNNEFEFEEGTLLRYNGTDTNIIIPDEINGEKVVRIAANAFYGNETLEYVEISSGIETIYYKAFAECSNLKAIFIPDSVKIIYDDSFYNCHQLMNVYYNGNLSTDWGNIKVYKMSNGMGTQQNSNASSCFPAEFALHNIIYKGNVFADMKETTSSEGGNETETTRPTRPTVDTGSNDDEDENESTNTRPTRPTVDLTTDDEDEETTNSKPTRPVVDTTVDSDETETNTTQTPSRPTVNTSDDESDSSGNQRPTRPTV